MLAIRGGVQQIYLRARSELQGNPISGTERGEQPFFSSDGEWLGFFAEGKLKKVSLRGGPALTLAEASSPNGATWGPDDTIVFAPRDASGLSRVSAAGGASAALTTLDSPKEVSHKWPEFLPGGRALIFTVVPATGSGEIALYVVDTGERRTLVSDASLVAHYASSGHLVYARGAALFAVAFNLSRFETDGRAVPIAEGLRFRFSSSQFSVSQQAWLAYVEGSMPTENSLVWVRRDGAESSVPLPPARYGTPRLSRNGRFLAASNDRQVWVYDLSSGAGTRLTFDSTGVLPAWSPDGNEIVFQTDPPASSLVRMKFDGSGAPEQLLKSDNDSGATSWSADGRIIVFFRAHPETDGDIWVLPLEGDKKPAPFLQTPADEGGATLSPDGRFLAYVSGESGRAEVYVQAFPGPGGKWQVSTEGGKEPVWARNGSELFYRTGDKLMAVSLETEPTFTAAKPRVLFADPYVKHVWFSANYDVSPDGQSFLMVKGVGEEAARLVVVQNWPELLKPPGAHAPP